MFPTTRRGTGEEKDGEPARRRVHFRRCFPKSRCRDACVPPFGIQLAKRPQRACLHLAHNGRPIGIVTRNRSSSSLSHRFRISYPAALSIVRVDARPRRAPSLEAVRRGQTRVPATRNATVAGKGEASQSESRVGSSPWKPILRSPRRRRRRSQTNRRIYVPLGALPSWSPLRPVFSLLPPPRHLRLLRGNRNPRTRGDRTVACAVCTGKCRGQVHRMRAREIRSDSGSSASTQMAIEQRVERGDKGTMWQG